MHLPSRLRSLPLIALTALLHTVPPATAQALLTAYRTGTPPTLDGSLDDSCWRQASITSMFLSAQATGLPEAQTQVRACWDEANLYLGVEAFEPFLNPKLNMLHAVKAGQTGPDANVFRDDCFEVFLRPDGRATFHFAANSGTGTYDARDGDSSWNCAWQCVPHRGAESYVLEIAVPFAALGARPAGEWRANFCRERTAVTELSTWSGLQGAFNQPEAFGTLRFAETGPALGEVRLTRAENALELHATMAGTQSAALEARVTAGKHAATASAQGSGNAELQVRVGLPEAATRSGRATLQYALRQGDQVVVRSAGVPQLIAAGVVRLSLAPRDAEVAAFLNGKPVAAAAGEARLDLAAGLNVIAVEATARGDAAAVAPKLEAAGRALTPRWLTRATPPVEGWRQALPGEGWNGVERRGEGIWAPGKPQQAFFACGVYVGDPTPQFFPKQDVCYLPRGSKQLMRVYLHAPIDMPQDGYRMVVEAPAGLKYVAAEPITGGNPVVAQAGTTETDGQKLARYHVTYGLMPRQGFELAMRWGDKANTTLAYEPTLSAGGTFGWRHLSMEVTPPLGAVSAHPLIIKWQNRGITGTFWVDNVSFHEKGADKNLLSLGAFDEPEYGKHGLLVPEGPDGSKCVRIVSTPQGADKQQAFWVDKESTVAVDPAKTYVIELDLRCERLGSPHGKPLCGLLFETPVEMAEGEYAAYTYFESLDGTLTELPQRSRVVVLPPLKDVRPQRARISPCYYSSLFRNDEVAKAYAENCRAAGIAWTYGKVNNNVVPELLPLGHKVFLSIGWEPWHALIEMRPFLEAHPELRAQDFGGKPLENVFCPTWLLTDGGEMIAHLQKWLLNTVNTEPYAGANWDVEQPVVDPPTFCTCPRCLTAFRKFAGLPADAPLDPDTILKQHRAQWTDFRCGQNAELAGHLKKALSKADRPVEFSLYSGYEGTHTREHYGVDWKKMAPHLDFGIAGYGGDRASVRATLDALGEVPFMGGEMWYLSDTDDAQPPPRMETWRNRLLRQYFDSGCHGCLIWWLPPMDGGAFYATSEAAELIAKYEDFFQQSRRCDEKVKVEGLDERNWAAFERGGETVVVLMNFGAEAATATVTLGGATRRSEVAAYGVGVIRR